jgi:hypothetical protein
MIYQQSGWTCDTTAYLPEEGRPAYSQAPHNSVSDHRTYNVFAKTWRMRAQGRKTPVTPTVLILTICERGNDQK